MRFPSAAGSRYQYESHGAIASGLSRTESALVVTACGLGKKDPTAWMSGGPNKPPPWDWRDDPARTARAVAECEIQPPGGGPRRRLGDVHAERGMEARFGEVAGVLAFAYGALAECRHYRACPPGDGPAGSTERRPFASPRHWAAFVALGDAGPALVAPAPPSACQ